MIIFPLVAVLPSAPPFGVGLVMYTVICSNLAIMFFSQFTGAVGYLLLKLCLLAFDIDFTYTRFSLNECLPFLQQIVLHVAAVSPLQNRMPTVHFF